MTTVSATIDIDNASYETLASLASITLTEGKSYSVQIQNILNWKVADAEFTFQNKDITWTQAADDVYVKVINAGQVAKITILENA